MTTMLVPGAVRDPALPRQPLRGLLGSPAAAASVQLTRIVGGANLYTYPEEMPQGSDPCVTGTLAQKETPEGVTLPDTFPGFTAYLGNVCTAAGIGDWNEFRARADVALRARTSWALERQLAWGTFADGPFLADADMQYPAGNAAIPALNAIAYLDGFLADRGQAGVIHLAASVATFLGPNALFLDGQGQLRTAAGTPVVVGSGYSDQGGTHDLNPTGSGGEAGAGQAWCFASSPVQYALDDTVYSLPETLMEALDREDNTVIYRAERDLWVAFDGGPHAGVLADFTPTVTGSP